MKHTSSWALRRVLKSLGRYLPLLLASLLLAAASVAGTPRAVPMSSANTRI